MNNTVHPDLHYLEIGVSRTALQGFTRKHTKDNLLKRIISLAILATSLVSLSACSGGSSSPSAIPTLTADSGGKQSLSGGKQSLSGGKQSLSGGKQSLSGGKQSL